MGLPPYVPSDPIKKFERKANTIEAARVDDDNIDTLAIWCGGKVVSVDRTPDEPYPGSNPYLQRSEPLGPDRSLYFPNVVEGVLVAKVGDWIFKNEQGRFESLSNKQFMELYEFSRPQHISTNLD